MASAIIRVKKDKGYFRVSNQPFNDRRLTWEARGMLGYLLSKPDDWTVRNGDLYKQGPAGINKVKRILKELSDHGYLVRRRIRKEDGTFEWETTLYETPPETTAPETANGLATGGKQCQLVKTESNKENGVHLRSSESSSLHYDNSSELSAVKSDDRYTDDSISENNPLKGLDDWKQHPGIQAVKQVSGYYPRVKLAARVANCLGPVPDIEVLQNCHDLWVAKGYNPMNLVWLFEWYPSRMHYTNPNDRAVLDYSPEYDFEGAEDEDETTWTDPFTSG